MNRANEKIWAVSYLLIVVAVVGLAVYTRAVDEHSARGNRETQACVGSVVQRFTIVNQRRSDASQRRDDALVGSKKAESELNKLRYIDKRPISDPMITEAARQYIYQTVRFIEASKELDTVRDHNKIPNFNTYCVDYLKQQREDREHIGQW